MSGFETAWLALREPADKAARAANLMAEVVAHCERLEAPTIMDIGCGTGATHRVLSAHLPTDARWYLVDNDPRLLGEAERRIGSIGVRYIQKDLTDLESLDLRGIDLMTASAFFDLCSQAFCDDLVERLSRQNIAFYAALNYDGRIRWSDPHERDCDVVDAFNRHQRGDKGFGAALGPEAAAWLERALLSRGYRIARADSRWELDGSHAALQDAFLRGMMLPVAEIGDIRPDDLEAWLAFRLGKVRDGGGLVVGHTDLWALPR
ncbi:hypothetical protein ASG25_00255 [Rhizobium sp. Leaf384]|uniref:class I SAM-dependent methyltransferase n=1 Tax=unclassified Rhizobium TaxID=2613769 RepID=UPI000715D465|nr:MULTISPECIES: class I SAM-dependent methyltransferase [unclassified Rhizobium]KQS74390.1 hypothetical protein ASG58_15450 [Rhizobium sp. Leaf383]KQS80129.1 hypothetical protein ASG25_00255 [Rhizobium sp. Leaf384]